MHPESEHGLRVQLATALRERDEARAEADKQRARRNLCQTDRNAYELQNEELRKALAAANARADRAEAEVRAISNDADRLPAMTREPDRYEEKAGKKCKRCGVVLTKDNAYSFELRRRNYLCIPCKLAEARSYKRGRQSVIDCANKWRAEHPERAAEFHKKSNAAYRAKPENRVKIKAYQMVRYAVAHGTLVRSASCETCGVECRIQAHHEDYTKPLDVRWLCQKCHQREHRKANADAG